MKILCTGDLHLGRRSTKVPESQASEHSASGAWSRIVDLAISQDVDCVALTGDIFDKDASYIQSYGPLEKGLLRLSNAGIPAVAVAGNHDYRALPHFAASSTSGLKLLGATGTWESATVDNTQILGVSFTDEFQARCPVDTCNPSSTACVVLAHADLDVMASSYGPVRLSDLKKLPVRAVLLGHVHKPNLINGGSGPLVLNPGSPQALDPNEPGRHGPWVVDISDASVTAQQIPISSVQYRKLELDLSAADSEMALRDLCVSLMSETAACDPYDCRKVVSVRLVLTGRTRVPEYRRIVSEATDNCISEPSLVVIERVEDLTRPALDINALAAGTDPPGLLAQMLLSLEQGQGSDDDRKLLQTVLSKLGDWQRRYRELSDQDYDAEQVRQLLIRQGYALLDALVRQQEDCNGG